MPFDLRDCQFHGHALPEPFARGDLETVLLAEKLLPKTTGTEGKSLSAFWSLYRRKLRSLHESSGPVAVERRVLEPLVAELGYARLRRDEPVATREGLENGGLLFETADGSAHLRAFALDAGADFDAPSKRGLAFRYSPTQVAQRVLLARGERLGLLTDGSELRLLFCDPARRESHIAIELQGDGGWRSALSVPDSFRLFSALARPAGVAQIPALVEQARLQQSRVTATLREQAKLAVRHFLQALLDDGDNAAFFARFDDKVDLGQRLYRDALVVVYRLLFILKLESSSDPERSFSFASQSLWRNTYSPTHALACLVRPILEGRETGAMLATGLRTLFRMFREGFTWSEMKVTKLGGMLFGEGTAPLLDDPALAWSELSAARLLGHLLWTPGGKKEEPRRVHYGPLQVEDLGRVYEALLELEPGIATEPMCRLRRQKLEVVVPAAQGEAYRESAAPAADVEADDEGPSDEAEEEDEKPARGKTRVQWIEGIAAGQFYLRVGLGRKASGSYYTPQAFVKFLVEETLGPQISERSPREAPDPQAILGLRVLDPAMGSGHFLVEVCRYLGDALYDACRACDERAESAERRSRTANTEVERETLRSEAAAWRKRVLDLPDPNDELVAYLPSHATEGARDTRSQGKALAVCRRLVAVHCLYGVDKNPLAVELAKLALWLESYAEGLPLTFVDHRFLCGDSLTGPFFDKLLTLPTKAGEPLEDLYSQGLEARLGAVLGEALTHVRDLEASIGKDEADIHHKREAKEKLDRALAPFRTLAAAWSGAVMLGKGLQDDYRALAAAVAEGRDVAGVLATRADLRHAVQVGSEGVCYDLVFPEVFWPDGKAAGRAGFHAVVGNPPWDALQPYAKEFYAGFDLRVLDAPTRLERASIEKRLRGDPAVVTAFNAYVGGIEGTKRLLDRTFAHVNRQPDGGASGAITDLWQPFAERSAKVLAPGGRFGVVLPSAFHANQSAAGIRDLLVRQMDLRTCFSFENRNKLFDIDSRFKFALVTATRAPAGEGPIACAFYLHDLEWLFGDRDPLPYTRAFIERTGGPGLSFLELRSPLDASVAEVLFKGAEAVGSVRERHHLRFGEELHMSKSSHLFTPIEKHGLKADPRDPEVATTLRAQGYLPLHEGKTFHQYDDRWEDRPRYLVALSDVADKPGWLRAASFYRLAFRDIASSTNERTGIFCLLPPGVLCGNTAPCEREPWQRRNADALQLLACLNTFAFDWTLRQKAAAHVNLFILDGCPVPPALFHGSRARFLAHSALRLTAHHAGYAALWKEQLHLTPLPPLRTGEGVSEGIRAAIDAVVADAYGLSREHYAHVLASFSHKSHKDAPGQCLAAFDELREGGLDAFVRAHDPYADVPLVESLPTPVLDLGAKSAAGQPAVGTAGQAALPGMDLGPAPTKKGRGRRG